MRLTKAVLKEYQELTSKIKAMEARAEEIRDAVIEDGRDEIVIDDIVISISTYEQERPKPVADIKEILGLDARKVLRKVKAHRVSVKKAA